MGLIRLDSSLSLRLWLTKVSTVSMSVLLKRINHSMTPGETIAASSISIKEESVVATESLTREDLIAYFASGCKPKQKWRIGTEHEKFGFEVNTLRIK
ncbi:glutamate--cysteine ligase, chloroplastic [Brassica napus]|uniref:glutamate--cysteine ligase, chloroplastic n=1 Tax=Brassica napus TaxID=3708 RepID=UPI00207998F5|nr:glutamate--cysteine ligase, chloroplastic [Brassica napus]